MYYSQADPSGFPHLKIVNWWSTRGIQKPGLYKLPLLPDADKVYEDFNGRSFNIPVLHVHHAAVSYYYLFFDYLLF